MITWSPRGNVKTTVYTCSINSDDIGVGSYLMATISMTLEGLLHGNHLDT